MNTQKIIQHAFLGLLVMALPGSLTAQTIVVPEGTAIFAEFQHDVRSKKKETATGDFILTRVAQDVVVDGTVVIAEGAELLFRVDYAKRAKIFGRKGRLQFEAVSVPAVDGGSAPLDGSYIRTGTGRKFVTATLAVAVAWPFAFLKGKQAMVPEARSWKPERTALSTSHRASEAGSHYSSRSPISTRGSGFEACGGSAASRAAQVSTVALLSTYSECT